MKNVSRFGYCLSGAGAALLLSGVTANAQTITYGTTTMTAETQTTMTLKSSFVASTGVGSLKLHPTFMITPKSSGDGDGTGGGSGNIEVAANPSSISVTDKGGSFDYTAVVSGLTCGQTYNFYAMGTLEGVSPHNSYGKIGQFQTQACGSGAIIKHAFTAGDATSLPGFGSCKLAQGNSGTACGWYLSNNGVGFHTDANGKPDGKGTGCADHGIAGHSDIVTVVDYVKFAIADGFCVDQTVHINHQFQASDATSLAGFGTCKLSQGNSGTACGWYLTNNGVGFHINAAGKPDGQGTGCADSGIAGHPEVKSVVDYVKFAINDGFCVDPNAHIKVISNTISEATALPGFGTCKLAAGNDQTACGFYLSNNGVGFHIDSNGKIDGKGTGCADHGIAGYPDVKTVTDYVKFAIKDGFCAPPVIIKRQVVFATLSDSDLVNRAKNPGLGGCKLFAGNPPATACHWYLKNNGVGFHLDAKGNLDSKGTGCATDFDQENNDAFVAKYIRLAIASKFCPATFDAP